MPDTRAFAAAFRRAPLGLLGMVLTVWAVEADVHRHKMRVTEPSPASWHYSRYQAHKEARRADILCFGSSLVKFGVYPTAVQKATGLSAFNLSVYTGRMASSYYLLKKALEAGATPKAVVVDCHDGPRPRTSSESEALTSNLRNWPELLDARECLELAWVARDPDFFAATMTARVLPTLNSRHELRKAIVRAFRAEPDPDWDAPTSLIRNWNLNRGTQVHANGTPESDATAPPAGWESRPPVKLDRAAVRPDPVLDTYARRLLDLAGRRNITVFWIMPPLPDFRQSHQDGDGVTDYVDTIAADLSSRHDNLVVVDGRRSSYPLKAFCDGKHLNRAGGLAFSSDLGDVIRLHLNGAPNSQRVYRLPKYADHDQGEPLEDILQSRLAIKALGRGRY